MVAVAGTLVTQAACAAAPYVISYVAQGASEWMGHLIRSFARSSTEDVIERGCASRGRDLMGGGDGIMGRIGFTVGGFFGRKIGAKAGQKVEEAVDGPTRVVEELAKQGTEALLHAALNKVTGNSAVGNAADETVENKQTIENNRVNASKAAAPVSPAQVSGVPAAPAAGQLDPQIFMIMQMMNDSHQKQMEMMAAQHKEQISLLTNHIDRLHGHIENLVAGRPPVSPTAGAEIPAAMYFGI